MKCKKCGEELRSDAKFCYECGQKVDIETNAQEIKEEVNNIKPVVLNENKEKRIVSSIKNDTFFCLLSIACYFGGPILQVLFGYLSEISKIFLVFTRVITLLPFIAYALAIYAKVKYPESKFAKILLIVYLVLFILGLIAIVIIIVSCAYMAQDCSSMGIIFNSLFK